MHVHAGGMFEFAGLISKGHPSKPKDFAISCRRSSRVFWPLQYVSVGKRWNRCKDTSRPKDDPSRTFISSSQWSNRVARWDQAGERQSSGAGAAEKHMNSEKP